MKRLGTRFTVSQKRRLMKGAIIAVIFLMIARTGDLGILALAIAAGYLLSK